MSGQQTIGRYEVIRAVGKGAQGAVYLGRDPALDRHVAIKVLTADNAELSSVDENGVPLEGRISSQLKHPNIIPIYDAGQFAVGPYLVFEYVEGQTLAERLKKRGPMSVADAVPLFAAILQALTVAHGAEVLHLDLSPRNILIDADDVPRIMDFGLAQYVSTERESKKTTAGTLRYMAPEHFLGRPLGPWTDVLALGSTFYEVVSGQRAMTGDTLESIQRTIISGTVDYSPLLGDPHGEAFATFLAGALEKEESGRFADAAAMLEAFELFLSQSDLDVQAQAGNHSTIDFLLRRMQRTGDFPTISKTLSDINRLTSDDANANADKLANVILRDFSLTGKLLKLVNSAFYGTRAAEITSISDAVVFLGVEKVRITANSLMFFGHMKSDSAVLKDSITKSFLCGLIARHLAQRARLPGKEEAFICGMCQNLGENLVIFYFADEYADINGLQDEKDLSKSAAARGVLGVSYAELGAAVAKTWNLPSAIVDAIRGIPPGPVQQPEDAGEQLRDIAVFANELCDMFQTQRPEDIETALLDLTTRFAPSVSLQPEYCAKLVTAAFEKLKQYAPIFEIDFGSSHYCRSVQSWLDAHVDELDEQQTA